MKTREDQPESPLTTDTDGGNPKIELAIVFPSDQYVERSVYASTATDVEEWSETFTALGGLECRVVPGGATDIEDTMTVLFVGARPSMDFLLDGLMA